MTCEGRGRVTTMIGKKMALLLLVGFQTEGWRHLPKKEEHDTKEDRQDADADCLGLLEDLDDTVQKCSNPEEPFEQGGQHETSNNGNIDNLLQSVPGPMFA